MLYLSLFIGIILELSVVPLWIMTGRFAAFIAAHSAGVIFLYAPLYYAFRKKMDDDILGPASWFGLILALFFPSLGIIAAVFIVSSKIMFAHKFKGGLYEEYEEYIKKSESMGGGAGALAGLLRNMRDEISFEPFVDIIKGNNDRMKQRVIDKLSRMATKDSVKLLKDALKDPSPEIRFYVAGGLLRIEGEITGKIAIAKEMVKERASCKDFAYLGDLYKMYADIGLSSEKLSRHYLALGSEAYKASLDMETDQEEVMVSYAGCLARLKDNKKAKALLDSAVKIWPGNAELVFLRSHVYFESGIFNELPKALDGINVENAREERKEVIELWKSAR